MEVPTTLYLQSELRVGGRAAALLANVWEALKTDSYLALTAAAKYIDPQELGTRHKGDDHEDRIGHQRPHDRKSTAIP